MFYFETGTRRAKCSTAVCASVAAHLLLLGLLLVHRPAPIFATPVSVAQGNGKTSYHLVYIAPYGNEDSDSTDHIPLTAKAALQKTMAPKRERRRPAPVNLQKGTSNDLYARAGTRYGSLLTGPAEGPEIRPALPVIFPDPPISRSDLPSGLQGDVIVEITIDTAGKVVDMRLLQSFERAIDDRVMTTLRGWQFRPATMDGIPVVSKHDVHFHFPS